jgi:hypothetical protein
MIKEFTVQFIKDNCGCYNLNKLKQVFETNNKTCFDEEICVISADDIINSDIPLKDKFWFFCKQVFTKEQNQQFAIQVAESVLHIYEDRYPNDTRVREAIGAAKLYLKGEIDLKTLRLKRRAAAVAYDDADDDAAALAAALAAAYAADAADIGFTAWVAAYAANDAAAAYDETDKLFKILKSFVCN